MDGDSHSSSIWRRWEMAAACLGGVLAAAAIALAAAAALPPSLENLASEISDGVTPVPIADGAEVVVPAEWIVVRQSGEGVVVRTPDGALQARLDTVEQDAAAVVAATPGVEGAARSEQLGSGMDATHADRADGGIVAAVRASDGGNVVRVVAEVRGADTAAYRPAVAELLEGIRT